jgi:hypothetical protein
MPTFKIGKERLDENGFINAFIKDVDREVQYENCVYLLFKPSNLSKFRIFLNEEYERTKFVVDDYDYENGYVVIVYQMDKKWKKDFDLIKQGKYSQTSFGFKEIFPKTVKLLKNGLRRDEVSLQHRIFKKGNDLKEFWENHLGVEFDETMEVWQGWIEEKEILDINKLIKENV